jgi:hypothetical protein
MNRREFFERTGAGLVVGSLPGRALDAGQDAGGDALAALRALLAEPPHAAKPMTRWWWFGGAVTPEEITRELAFMKEAGLRGAEIQPVYPVAVDDPARGIQHLYYYTEEWWRVVRHAVREAHRLGLQLDFTLGSGWPYGGPFVEPSHAARRLRPLSRDVVGPRELLWDVTPLLTGDDRPVAVVAAPVTPEALLDLERARVLADQPEPDPAGGPRRGRQVRFDVPEGTWRVTLVLDVPTGQLVKRPTLGMEGRVLDHHSREAMALFLRAAGDQVVDAVRDGGDPPFHSVFCDSLEVYGADWTPALLEEFEKRRGYDLAPFLPALWQDAGPPTPHVRYDYHLTLSELNLEYFFEPLAAWASSRGMQARIQAHGAPGDVMRAYGIAHVPEGENIFLGDRYQVNLRHRRLASSAAHLYGKPLASSETYTWLRTPLYVTTLEMMKAATDAVLLDGLNHIVNHGYSYTPPQAGEPGWAFYASTAINHTNIWWRHYPHLARYIQRACALLQRGVAVNPVAVYLPVAELFAAHGIGGLHIDVEAEAQIDPRLFAGLRQSGYDFDLVHDHALAELAEVREGQLRAGTGRYSAVIVPPVRWMPPESVARLAALAEAGGHVVFVEGFPDGPPGLAEAEARGAAFRTALERLKAAGASRVEDAPAALARLREVLEPDFRIVKAGDGAAAAAALARENVGFMHRREGDVDWYFVANVSGHPQELRVCFDAGRRRPERWAPETGLALEALAYAYVSDGGAGATEVDLHLEPFESCFVVFGTSAEPPLVTHADWPGPLRIQRSGQGIEVEGRVAANRGYELRLANGETRAFEVRNLPEPVTLEGPWSLALGEQPTFELPGLRSWTELPQGRGFSGWGRYRIEFQGPVAEGVDWLIDLGIVHETAEVRLNGESLGAAWKSPRRLPCGAALRRGANALEVEVANLWIHAMLERKTPPEWEQLELSHGVRWGRYGEVPPETVPPAGLLGPVRLVPTRLVKRLV